MAKELEDFDSLRIQKEILEPLGKLIEDFQADVGRLVIAHRKGEIARSYLQMNAKGARTAMKKLRSFWKKEFHDKLDEAIEGSYRWKDDEQKFSRREKEGG